MHQMVYLSFQINTDGVAISCYNGKGEVWPIFLSHDELDSPTQRNYQKNMMMVGLWHDGKFDMDIFMKPLQEKINKLFNN